MIEVLRSNDVVRLSWAEAVLAEAGIPVFIADAHASVVDGSIAAIQRRVMVEAAEADRAKQLLKEAARRDGVE